MAFYIAGMRMLSYSNVDVDFRFIMKERMPGCFLWRDIAVFADKRLRDRTSELTAILCICVETEERYASGKKNVDVSPQTLTVRCQGCVETHRHAHTFTKPDP